MSNRTAKSNSDNGNARQSVLGAASTVGGWTMLSRILGFIRDVLLARVLGAGPLADAFFVAFKLPNFFRRMFAEGTLTVALVPVLADERKKGDGEAHAYLNALATLLLVVLLLFTVAGIIFMPWLLLGFAPGFHDEPDRWDQALLLARWMFPYLLLISLSAMSWAVLNAHRKFSLAAASPALLNVAIIFSAIILAPSFENPAKALAIGVVLGGILQLAIQFPALKRIGWIPRLSFKFRNPAVSQTLRLFGPALLGVAAVQINILVGTILATLLPAGAVSYLYYADRIVQLPLALFGIAMGTALLPALSEHMANQRIDDAKEDLRNGLAWLTWITLPAMIGIFILAEPIIATLFEHG
ncbi:MAG: murein biosynthesis integral membrane protein MurJ, partial [Zetaproteobacteria bacterium]|nr:murein biosynthesis integral membrane protein MurJ [Zetaproteobacteria bacterium]